MTRTQYVMYAIKCHHFTVVNSASKFRTPNFHVFSHVGNWWSSDTCQHIIASSVELALIVFMTFYEVTEEYMGSFRAHTTNIAIYGPSNQYIRCQQNITDMVYNSQVNSSIAPG